MLRLSPGWAGIDEAGRGPIAGPVVVAGALVPADFDAAGVHDSKRLKAERRDALYQRIMADCRIEIEIVSWDEIDRVNILRATLRGMRSVADRLAPECEGFLIDGDKAPPGLANARCIVKGDGTFVAIAAASIVAKVTRDRLMVQMAAEYPGYGFDRHFGYGTPEHLAALARLGPCPIHRRSFAPMRPDEQPCLILES